MPGGVSVQVVGAEQLASTLGRAGDDLQDMTNAGEAASKVILARARGLVPRASGRLAGSLFATVERDEIDVGSDVVYAGVIEWGWRARNIAPQAYLWPAAHESEPATVRAYTDDTQRILGKVKGA